MGDNLLQAMNLKGMYLFGGDLSNLQLTGISLQKSILSSSDLQGSDLRSAHLDSSDFLQANLKDTDLSYARLQGANLSFITVNDQTSFREATYDDKTVFPENLDPKAQGMIHVDELKKMDKENKK